jgi:hypothetical protein
MNDFFCIAAENGSHITLNDNDRTLIHLNVLHIMKNIDSNVIRKWLLKENSTTLTRLINMTKDSAIFFQYSGRTAIEEKIANNTTIKSVTAGNTKRYIENVHKANNAAMSLRELRSNLRMGGTVTSSKGSETRQSNIFTLGIQRDVKLDAWLSHEVSLSLLDIFVLYYGFYAKDKVVLEQVCDILISMLKINQCQEVVHHVFLYLTEFVIKNSNFLFRGRSRFCVTLCDTLLRYLGSVVNEIRKDASGLMYVMMKYNFRESGNRNFTKVRIQTTISLSQTDVHDDGYLKRSFVAIENYAKRDKKPPSHDFQIKVVEVLDNLYAILKDRVRMKQYEDDYFMLADMHYRVAKGYHNTPDLRVITLQTLADLHIKHKKFAEGALCLIHASAIISEYINRTNPKYGGPKGAIDFKAITPMIVDEKGVVTDDMNFVKCC